MPLILASASPRRRQLLALLGRPFSVQPANVAERAICAPGPAALAQALARELEAEVRPTLLKVRHNPPQSRTKSAAARRANVLGVYRILPDAPVSGAKILVVDDIITTGATLSACGQVLRLAGAADLVCAAIAATDHKDGAAQH